MGCSAEEHPDGAFERKARAKAKDYGRLGQNAVMREQSIRPSQHIHLMLPEAYGVRLLRAHMTSTRQGVMARYFHGMYRIGLTCRVTSY